ncbi:hypothetical protein Zmor_018910 [Zophobas morio]|uniref:Uncharacterized protein n=1 Tax=Zophobas morio TaxID=2755281 RepID=A0AA38MEI7_9CUCU|nr:hypothetical protein Zmor_018910 [Zophobas morio]
MINNRKREASTTLAKTNIVNKQPIVGKRSDSVTIRASPAKAYLYIRRLAKSTTAADLKGYLVEDFPEVVCEPLKTMKRLTQDSRLLLILIILKRSTIRITGQMES